MFKGVLNDGCDNENNDYILRVNDVILSMTKERAIKNE